MRTIPLIGWIANAAARLTGSRGAVTARARETGYCRQTVYDHARKVELAVEAERSSGPTREELARENEVLRQENIQLWGSLDKTVDFGLATRQEFSVTATAMGISHNQILALDDDSAGCPGVSRSLDDSFKAYFVMAEALANYRMDSWTLPCRRTPAPGSEPWRPGFVD